MFTSYNLTTEGNFSLVFMIFFLIVKTIKIYIYKIQFLNIKLINIIKIINICYM